MTTQIEKVKEMTPGQKAYADFVREMREKISPVRTRFTKKTNISDPQLREIEKGEAVGSPETMIAIAKGLGVRPGLLLDLLAGLDVNAELESLSAMPLPPNLTPDQREMVRLFAEFLSQITERQVLASGQLPPEQLSAASLAMLERYEAKSIAQNQNQNLTGEGAVAPIPVPHQSQGSTA